MMSYETKVTRARERAILEAPELSAFWITDTTAKVFGRTGNEYVVTVDGDRYNCTCPAGVHSCPCWHAEALRMLTRPAGTVDVPADKPADVPAEDEQPKRRECPSCAGTIDPIGDYCITGRLFGGCSYNTAKKAA